MSTSTHICPGTEWRHRYKPIDMNMSDVESIKYYRKNLSRV
jgi:hypothetical protein